MWRLQFRLMVRRAKLTIVLTVCLAALVGCAPTTPATVTVFAAASLTETFEAIATAFEQENPETSVVLNFGGSSALAQQIEQGAPADVFAAASSEVLDGEVFATNTLVIGVAHGNPGDVRSLFDFSRPNLAIAVCAVEVPCGAAAQQAFDNAGIAASIDTFELDVKAVFTKLDLGEVDAGLIYRTDVRGSVEAIEFDGSEAVRTSYPIAALTATDAAEAFVDFVLSEKGQKILRDAGFGAP